MASPFGGFQLPSQTNNAATRGYSSPFANLDVGKLQSQIATRERAAGIASGNAKLINFNDPGDVSTALQNIQSFKNPNDQAKIAQHAARHGLIDKSKAAAAVNQLLGPQKADFNPHLNPLEHIVNFAVGAGKTTASSIGQIAKDVSMSNPETHLYAGADQKLVTGKTSHGNPNGEALAYTKSHEKQMGGDALTALSLLAGPEAKTVLSGGATGVKAALKLGGLGAAGGEGLTLQTNPNASAKEQLINSLIGAGAGLALPVVGSVVGKGATKVAESALSSDAIKSVAPYISKADQLTKDAFSRVGSGAKNALEAVPGGKAISSAAGKANDLFQQKFVSSLHPVYKVLRAAEASGKLPAGSVDRLDALRAARVSSGRDAEHFIQNDPHIREAIQSAAALSKNNQEAMGAASDYITAKREIQLMDQGRKVANADRRAEFQTTIDNLEAKYGKDKLENARQKFIAADQKVSGLLQGTGLSKADLDHYRTTDPESIRMQREIDQYRLKHNFGQGTGGMANQAAQKINKFADSKALPAYETLFDKTYHTHNFVATQNFMKGSHELLRGAGVPMKALQTTKKVMTKRELLSSLKASKPLARDLKKLASQHKDIISQLDKEMKGLQGNIRAKVAAKSEDIKNYMIRESTGGKLAGSGSKVIGEIKNPEELLHAYMSSKEGGFRSMLDRLAFKNEKAANLRADLETISRQLKRVNQERTSQYWKARALASEAAHGAPTISFYEDGIKNTYKVPGELADSLKDFNRVQLGNFAKSARLVNNVFKYGTTQGNPAFAIPNFIKDQVSSALNSENVWRTHNPAIFAEAVYSTITRKNGEFEDFMRHMADVNYVNVNKNLMKATEDVRKSFQSERSGIDKVRSGNGWTVLRDGGSWAKNGYDSFVNRLEFATRYQNYKGTKQFYISKGYAPEAAEQRALQAARRNSVDFSDAGDFGRAMNNFVPYFNAAIQGTRTLARSVRERPATTSAKLVTATMPVMALSYWNMSDPKRAAVYANVPEYQRKTNFVIVAGNHAYLIPMSQELQAVADVPRSMMEAKYGYDPKSFATQGSDFLKALSPVNADTWGGAMAGVLPPQFRAGLELAANKSFYTGQQIVPDSVKAQNQDPTQQVYRDKNGNPVGVSGIAQKVANVLHTSPLDVQYYLKNSLGSSVGQNGLNALDTVSGNQTGTPNVPQSIAKRFQAGDTNVASSFNNLYYPLSDSKNYKQKQINTLLYNGQIAKAQRVASDWNNYVDQQFHPYYKQYGQFVEQNVPNSTQRVGNLKLDVKVSKKGRGYIK